MVGIATTKVAQESRLVAERGPSWQRRASKRARYEAGQSRRDDLPLEAHADLSPERGRRDPLGVLGEQDASRLPELIPIRYGRMSDTAFTYLRGAAAVMASDLSQMPRTDLEVQLCGDAHLDNFGVFNAPDRRLLFDINDFDETLPGPFEWDLKRLAASVTVAGRNNEISARKVREATMMAVRGYRETMASVAQTDPLEQYYFRIEFDKLAELSPTRKSRKRLSKLRRKATRKNSLRAQSRLTDVVAGRRMIVADPPLVQRVPAFREPEEMARLQQFFERYRATLPADRRHLLDSYSLADIALKVVGVGSVGTRSLILLLESGDGAPLFLQFKEATSSVLEPFLKPSVFEQSGRRVVQGQRLIQAQSDIFLGWARWNGDGDEPTDFYIRQLWDGKGSLDTDSMGGGRLKRYAEVCGRTLAVAHARAGDPAMLAGYLGSEDTFDQAVTEFATSYADRTERDHALMQEAIGDGRISAIHDI
jgi:uncharacterized protein (DUF2252 family)